VRSGMSTFDPANILNPTIDFEMDPNAYAEYCPTLRHPDADDSEPTHVVNTTETPGSTSVSRMSATLLLGGINRASLLPVMTGRDNNVETDPALQGVCEIDADTLRRAEIREHNVEKSTVMAKELEMMRKACWQGVGQTPAPAPGSIVDKQNNLHPIAYNILWRDWIISVATDYFDQNDLPSVEHINNDWTVACNMLAAAQGIIGPLCGCDMRVSPNAIVKVGDLDIYAVSDSTHSVHGLGKNGKNQDIKRVLEQCCTQCDCEVIAHPGATADMLIDHVTEVGDLMMKNK
jgi:hypothetical protein